ncbi:hypothetical protein YQE_09467, partial [Dendroctonus ponderosae]
YFGSVYQGSSIYQGNLSESFNFSLITEEHVKQSIHKLKPRKATGSDSVPGYILKGCSDVFLRPLSHLFNLSLKIDAFPDRLKESIITLIFKTGNVGEVQNYRPVSILNSLAKIFETILYNDIMESFGNLFAPEQRGFLPGENLNAVANWFKDNGMFLNEEKSGVLSFTRKLSFIDGHYHVNKRALVRKTTCRFLGVHLQASLKFGEHYTNITNKSCKILGFVIKNSEHFHIDTTIRLYNALVRPHLEYASVIWAS